LKPTFGLMSHFGVGFGFDQSVDYVGPMARYVEDVAAALDAVAGYDGYDPRQDRTVPLKTEALGSLTHGVKGLRIGILEQGSIDAAPDVRDAVMAAVEVLVAAGADAKRVSIPEHLTVGVPQNVVVSQGGRAVFDIGFFGAFAKTYYPATWIAAAHRAYHDQTDRLLPRRKLNLIVSEFSRRRFRGADYAKAQNVRSGFKRAYDEALEKVDVLALPTCLDVAPKYTKPDSLIDRDFLPRRFTRNTNPFNYTGHPALSVPCGKSGGLPIGMQLVGRYYADPTLLRVAYAYQHSVDWEQLIAPPAGTREKAAAVK
jgi:amidase